MKKLRRKRLNIGGGINRYLAPLGDEEPYVYYADGVIGENPPALTVLNRDVVKNNIGNALDIKEVYKEDGTPIIYSRTISSCYLDTTAISGIPQINTNKRYSSTTFRGKLLIATENETTYSIDLNKTPYQAVSMNDETTKFAPKGGLIASFKNRVWISGNNSTIINPDIVIPLGVIGVPLTSGTGIYALPKKVDFGTAHKLTETPPRTIIIQNMGTQAVKIIGISIKGNDFKIVQMPVMPYNLGSGQIIAIQVAFSPEDKGTREGTLVISTNMAPEEDCGSWTSSGDTVTLSSKTLKEGFYKDNYYAHLETDTNVYDIPIVDNTATTIVLNKEIGSLSGSVCQIRHNPTITIDLVGKGTTRLFLPNPPFVDFGQWVSYGSGEVEQSMIVTLTNPYYDEIIVPANNFNIVKDNNVDFKIKEYKINDGEWISGPPTTELKIEANKSLSLKMVAEVSGTGYFSGTLTIKTKETAKPNRLYFSAINNEFEWDTSVDWIDFIDKKGQAGEVQALINYSDMLWVFTESSAYCLTGNSPESFRRQEHPLLAGVGIANPFAWTISGGYLFIVSKSGIYRIAGTNISNISNLLGDLWKNIQDFKAIRCAGYNGNLVVYTKELGLLIYSKQGCWTVDSSYANKIKAMANQDGGNLTGTIIYSQSDGIYGFGQNKDGNKNIVIETPYDFLGYTTTIKRVLKATIYGEDIEKLNITGFSDEGYISEGYPLSPTIVQTSDLTRGTGYKEFIFDDYFIGTSFRFKIEGEATCDSIIYGIDILYEVLTDTLSVI